MFLDSSYLINIHCVLTLSSSNESPLRDLSIAAVLNSGHVVRKGHIILQMQVQCICMYTGKDQP